MKIRGRSKITQPTANNLYAIGWGRIILLQFRVSGTFSNQRFWLLRVNSVK